MKRLALAISIAAAFLVGYAGATHAYPGVPDRNEHYGYFNNIFDDQGDNVLNGGIPSWVGQADQLIFFIEQNLDGTNGRAKTGAAFIIQYMLGAPYSRTYLPNASQRADWESRVRFADAHGRIFWFTGYTYNTNSYWQGNNGGGPEPNDEAFYWNNDIRTAILIRNAAGADAVAIKRDCANPVAMNGMPGLDQLWAMRGRSTVSNSSPSPGQSITFDHYLLNYGETQASNIWEAPFDGPSSAATGLSSAASNVGDFQGGEERLVQSETMTIPSNAAAGTKYCRLIGWDPDNSWGGHNGRGSEVCATVAIPAKLKAAMGVAPSTMAPGDTATFTPSVSATGNSTPITVNCSIARTLFPPTGGSSSLGSQPCVTTAGSTNISIGSGASVVLRANTYASADSIAVGSRICDVITITNPSAASYFTNPADQTATQCVTIAKTPYVYFLGGDVWSGGGFAAVAPGSCNNAGNITTVTRASTLSADGSRPGSGTEYAAFALGKITNFGSAGMALVNATGVGDAWTFSNLNTSNLGYYGASQHCITDYIPTYQASTVLAGNTTIDVGTRPNGEWHVTGTLTIHGTMPAGSRQVYYADGNVEVDSDLKYPASYANAAAIPSLVVITKGDVHAWTATNQIDGIFESRGDGTTTGVFRTCWPKIVPATITTCPTTLTVNGAVYAAALDLHRTAGANGATPALQKAPAEIFNLSPEVYINNALNPSGQTALTTTNVRELPPRF
jgi:hypothetical protein